MPSDIPDMGSSSVGGKIPDNILIGVGVKTELANKRISELENLPTVSGELKRAGEGLDDVFKMRSW